MKGHERKGSSAGGGQGHSWHADSSRVRISQTKHSEKTRAGKVKRHKVALYFYSRREGQQITGSCFCQWHTVKRAKNKNSTGHTGLTSKQHATVGTALCRWTRLMHNGSRSSALIWRWVHKWSGQLPVTSEVWFRKIEITKHERNFNEEFRPDDISNYSLE